MPLAEKGRRVAVFLENLGDRCLFQRKAGLPHWTLRRENMLDAAALLISPSQKCRSSRAADRSIGVKIGELHAAFCKRVDVRRFDFRAAVTTDVTVPQVVGHYQNDIGPGSLLGFGRRDSGLQ